MSSARSRGISNASAPMQQQAHLVMEIAGLWRICNGSSGIDDGIRRLEEEEWRVALRILPHLAGMCGIVATYAEDATDRKPRGFICDRYRGRWRRIEHVALGHLVLLLRWLAPPILTMGPEVRLRASRCAEDCPQPYGTCGQLVLPRSDYDPSHAPACPE